jgi:hypothetical protein
MSHTFLPRDVIDDGLYNPRGQMLANLSIAFACLSFLFVAVRLMTRYFIQKSLGLDDFLIVPALVSEQRHRRCMTPLISNRSWLS